MHLFQVLIENLTATSLLAAGLVGALFLALLVIWPLLRRNQRLQEQALTLQGTSVTLETVTAERNNLRETLAQLSDEYSELQTMYARLEERATQRERSYQEQITQLTKVENRLKDTLSGVSNEALRSNTELFLKQAQQKLGHLYESSQSQLSKQCATMENLVSPLSKSFEELQVQLRELELNRQHDLGAFRDLLSSVRTENRSLTDATRALTTALRTPSVRGRWGEIQLRRTVELAGMMEHCDFVEQENSLNSEGRVQRPDLIVKLPDNGRVIIDAKTPLQSYLDALDIENSELRAEKLKAHAQSVRGHARALCSKKYHDQFDFTPQLTVMFLPGESFFYAAIESDRTLVEDTAAWNVILATPTTLIALLRTIALGWKQQSISENAIKISKCGEELSQRLVTLAKHFAGLRGNIQRVVESFNQTTASYEVRVLPKARQLAEFNAAAAPPEVEVLDDDVRSLGMNPPTALRN